jgi:hypothetical protein
MAIEVILPHQAPEYFIKEISKSTKRHQFNISDHARNYLVNLLTDFISPEDKLFKEKDFWDKSITLMYKACEEAPNQSLRELRYQQLGDVCLFKIGYFYDNIKQNGNSQVRYHVEIGTTAYSRSTEIKINKELSSKFIDLTMIIGDLHLAELDNNKNFISLLEKWSNTNDNRYASLLRAKKVIIPENLKNPNN